MVKAGIRQARSSSNLLSSQNTTGSNAASTSVTSLIQIPTAQQSLLQPLSLQVFNFISKRVYILETLELVPLLSIIVSLSLICFFLFINAISPSNTIFHSLFSRNFPSSRLSMAMTKEILFSLSLSLSLSVSLLISLFICCSMLTSLVIVTFLL